jgi:tetratricopeptide (TPR) repeat protein
MKPPIRFSGPSSRDFGAIARNRRQERIIAAATVEPLLKAHQDDLAALAQNRNLRTAGALERLSAIVVDSLTRDPKHALAVAQLAATIADGLPYTAYPAVTMAQLRGFAWRDLGNTLRSLARYDESVRAFNNAVAAIEDCAALGHDLALIKFNLAIPFQEMERFDESLALLAESKAIFNEYGDLAGSVRCGIAEGVLLQRLRKYREAREIYLVLLSSTPTTETESLAALHQAIGFCSVELGDYRTAEANLDTARRLNQQLGRPIELMKIELGRGRLFNRYCRFQEAIDLLRPVRRQFLSHGMPEEAGLCGLEVVDAMLLLGKASQAESLTRRLIDEFAKAGLNTRAITALGYLTEAIASRNVPPDLVGQVSEYIVSLQTAPERDFVYREV